MRETTASGEQAGEQQTELTRAIGPKLLLLRETVKYLHFRAPTWTPWVGAVLCGYLVTPLSGRDAREYLIAAVLLAVGVALYLVNRLLVGEVEFDPARLYRE